MAPAGDSPVGAAAIFKLKLYLIYLERQPWGCFFAAGSTSGEAEAGTGENYTSRITCINSADPFLLQYIYFKYRLGYISFKL